MVNQNMLTTDLKMLVAVTILALISFMPYFMAYLKYWGISGIVGNRENLPELPKWAQRGQAAHQNLTENLVHFPVLVLLAYVLGAANEITALGAMVFFWARVVYLLVYIAGIPWIRTLAFVAGWIGEIMILSQLF